MTKVIHVNVTRSPMLIVRPADIMERGDSLRQAQLFPIYHARREQRQTAAGVPCLKAVGPLTSKRDMPALQVLSITMLSQSEGVRKKRREPSAERQLPLSGREKYR